MKVSYLKKFLAITLIFVMQFQSVHASVAIGGGWGLNLTRVENSTSIFTAFKDGFQSTVAISPSSAQVAKSLLRGGLVGLAMVAVTQVLEDGVDYLLDSANQDLKYRVKPKNNTTYLNPYGWYYIYETGFYPTANLACKSTLEYNKRQYPNSANSITKLETQFYPEGTSATCYMYDATNKLINLYTVGFNKNPNYNPKLTNGLTEKRIPLLQLATKIIASAEQGNPEAKAYIASVVQDMLEHDEEYRKSLEAQLDAKLKEATQTKTPNDDCPSGKRNEHGDCWACPLESFAPIRGRVNYAKAVTGGLGKCYKSMNSSQLLTRYKAYSELGTARDAENKCWRPTDEEHIRQANEAKDISRECNQFLGLLGR